MDLMRGSYCMKIGVPMYGKGRPSTWHADIFWRVWPFPRLAGFLAWRGGGVGQETMELARPIEEPSQLCIGRARSASCFARVRTEYEVIRCAKYDNYHMMHVRVDRSQKWDVLQRPKFTLCRFLGISLLFNLVPALTLCGRGRGIAQKPQRRSMATPCLIWIGIREPVSNKYSQVKVEKIVPARDVGFAVQMKNQKKRCSHNQWMLLCRWARKKSKNGYCFIASHDAGET